MKVITSHILAALHRRVLLALSVSLFASSIAFAVSNTGLVYQGRIVKPDGITPLTDSNVQFSIQIYGNSTLLGNGVSGADRCLLYQETQTLDMTSSNGVFSLTIGQGTSPTFGTGVTSLVTVFRNPQNSAPAASEAIGAISCTSGQTKYLSSAWDNNREVVVTITSGATVLNLAAMPIQAVPYAEQALQVGGYSSDYLMRVQSSRPGSANSFTANQFDFLLNLGINTVTPGVPSTYQATNLLAVDPTANQQVATKHYVDTQIATVTPSTTGVTAGTYGSATQIPKITVDAYGRITSATVVTISGVSPTGSTLNDGQIWIGNSSNIATPVSTSGDISLSDTGVFTVQKIQGVDVATTVPTNNQVLQYNGSKWIPTTFSTGSTISGGTSKVLSMFNSSGDNVINSSVTDNGISGVDFANSLITFTGTSVLTTAGTENLAVGAGAGVLGSYNTGIGNKALHNFSGYYSVGVGDQALMNGTGNYNIGIGLSSIYGDSTGTGNTAVGVQSLYSVATGSYNIAVGNGVMGSMTGDKNVGLGWAAGSLINGASSSNVFLGYKAGPATGGTFSNKLYIHNDQSDTPLIGGDFSNGYVQINNQIEIPLSSTTPTPNSGYGRIYAKSDGNLYFQNATTETQLNGGGGSSISGTYKNVPMINSSGNGLTASSINDNGASGVDFANSKITFNGTTFAYTQNTANNMFFGSPSGNASTSGNWLLGIGNYTLNANTTGASNVAVGGGALQANTTGSFNASFGGGLSANTTGSGNTAVGVSALGTITLGSANTAVGYSAMWAASGTASINNAFGQNSLYTNSGNHNTGMGTNALYSNTTGSYNSALGNYSLDSNTTGNRNTAVGYDAGISLHSGDGNVFIGADSGSSSNSNVSNKLYIHNAASDTPLIGGDFSGGYVQINSRLEVPLTSSTPTPSSGYGSLYAKSDGKLYFTDGTTETQLGSGSGSSISGTSKNIPMINATGDGLTASSITDNGASGVNFANSKIAFGGSTFIHNNGTQNVAMGVQAWSGASGIQGVSIGYQALMGNTGDRNTAVGAYALNSNSSGSDNVAIGRVAMLANATGSNNVAIGSAALDQSTGAGNIGLGATAIAHMSTGDNNVAVGNNIGANFVGGTGNIFLGANAGPSSSGPSSFDNKLYIHNSASDTPLIGGDFSAGYVQINNQIEVPLSSTTPTPNAGYGRIYAKTDGNLYYKNATTETQLNTGGGGGGTTISGGTSKVLTMFNTTGDNVINSSLTDTGTTGVNFANSRIQFNGSLFMHNRGTENTFVGVQAGNTSFTVGSAIDNTVVGFQAMPAVTSGSSNTAVGAGAGYGLTSGTNSVFVGVDAGSTVTTGTENTVIGVYAAMNGNFNNVTALGSQALRSATSGGNNTAVGQAALNGLTTGSYNTAIGVEAGSGFHGGNVANSTAVGYQALYYASGNNNTAVGYEALSNTTTGTNNTAIGWGAGGDSAVNAASSNSVFIGYNANPSTSGTYSNRLFINNSKSDTPLIGGDFSAGYVQINKQLELPLSATTPTPNSGYGRVYAKADGNLYFQNGTSEFWLNSQSGGGTYSLGQIPVYNGSGLAGVSCSSGQVLAWNVTTGFGCSDVTATQLQGRSIASTAPTTGQLLQYNGSSWVPVSGLEVSGGAIYTDTQANADGVVNIDFTKGNVQTSANTTNNAAFNLCGLKDGGSYSLVLVGQPINSTPTFAVYSDSACSSPITNFDSGGVTLTTTTATSIITLIRAGNTVYAMWATGFTH